jgi:3-oxoacyl-[acyl-carrier-protein] synthase-3
MTRAILAGTGLFAPGAPIDNDFFSRQYGRDLNSFLVEKRGIRSRHFMSADQATSDLILPAARDALKDANIEPDALDLILVATDTPDYLSPSTAAVVQYRLGAKQAGTFDLNSACSGFVTALDVASKYIASDERYNNILVCGAYGMSKFFDWDDYKTTSIFADGAGAVVVSRAPGGGGIGKPERFGILATELSTDGVYHDHMGIYAGGTRIPISPEAIASKQHLLQFTKRIPPETNSVRWPLVIQRLLTRLDAKVEEVDHFFFTQININSINETLDQLGVPHDLAHNVMGQFGYTGSACIPMALADASLKHKLRQNDLVLLVGSGGGLSMASMALRWAYDT